MKTRLLFNTAALLGAVAILWMGLDFIGANLLALAVTAVIGFVYILGQLELVQYRAATAGLNTALDAVGDGGGDDLERWLTQVPATLHNSVSQRVQGDRVGLPVPVFSRAAPAIIARSCCASDRAVSTAASPRTSLSVSPPSAVRSTSTVVSGERVIFPPPGKGTVRSRDPEAITSSSSGLSAATTGSIASVELSFHKDLPTHRPPQNAAIVAARSANAKPVRCGGASRLLGRSRSMRSHTRATRASSAWSRRSFGAIGGRERRLMKTPLYCLDRRNDRREIFARG